VLLRQHLGHISGAGCYIYFLQAISFPQTALSERFSVIDELFNIVNFRGYVAARVVFNMSDIVLH
jgi:hypothetical protein